MLNIHSVNSTYGSAEWFPTVSNLLYIPPQTVFRFSIEVYISRAGDDITQCGVPANLRAAFSYLLLDIHVSIELSHLVPSGISPIKKGRKD